MKVKPEEIRSILVIKLRHIGDVLLTTPAFRALRVAYPGAKIYAVVNSGTADMLTLNPNIDEVIPLKKGQGMLRELEFIKRVRALKPDLAINMTEGDRGAIMALLSGARYRIGVDPEGEGFFGKKFLYSHTVGYPRMRTHRVFMDLGLLAPLGIKADKPRLELYFSPDDAMAVESLLKTNGITDGDRIAVVHPTSRWLFKCWRDEAAAGVIDYLEGRGIKVILTSGPEKKELDKIASIISLTKNKPVDLSGRLTLKQLAALIKRSLLYFGVDTAPMHMAAAVGTPVVALFGPSDSKVWGPFSDKSKVIALEDRFDCMPCHQDGCGGSKKSRCLEAITEEETITAIDEVLDASV